MSEIEDLLTRAERLLERLGRLAPAPAPPPRWERALAWRWERRAGRGALQPIERIAPVGLDDVLCVERQKQELDRNTRQFVEGRPANNALLWGARGTGKSSLVKALLNTYAPRGLRAVEVARDDLGDLPHIVAELDGRPERFVLYCDDLSFGADDPSYTSLKATLDGSVAAAPENLVIYATSNRRHLMPEAMQENLEGRTVGGEIHPAEATEEKISLSDRFGLWLSFYPFDHNAYLSIVRHWLHRLGVEPAPSAAAVEQAALQWAMARGSRSGRTAYQFARDWAGRMTPKG